jgi:hypothetical protein
MGSSIRSVYTNQNKRLNSILIARNILFLAMEFLLKGSSCFIQLAGSPGRAQFRFDRPLDMQRHRLYLGHYDISCMADVLVYYDLSWRMGTNADHKK